MAITQEELDSLTSVNLPKAEVDQAVKVDSIQDFREQATAMFKESIDSTRYSTEPQEDSNITLSIAEAPTEAAIAAVEVPAVLGAGLAGTVVGGVEAAGRGVLGIVDSDFYPQESGYEGFEDLIKKRQAQFSINPEGDYSKSILGGLAWAGNKAEEAATAVGQFVGYDVGESLNIDKPEVRAGIATATKLFAEGAIDVATGKALTTAARVTKVGPASLKKLSLAELRKTKDAYVKRATDKILDDWTDTVKDQVGIMESLESAQVIENTIPGYRFDLAEATQSDVLRGQKKDLVTKFDPAQQRILQQRTINEKAINDYTKKIFGDDFEAFGSLIDNSNKSYGSIISNIDNKILQDKQKLQKLRYDISVTGKESTKQGKLIQKLSADEFKLNKAKADVMFDAIGDVPVNITNVYGTAKQILSSKGIWDQDAFPSIVSDLVSKLESRKPGMSQLLSGAQRVEAIPLKDFRDLYTEVNKALTATRHKPESNVNKSNQLRLLGQLKAATKEALENSKKDPISGKDSQAYSDAIDFWRDEVAEPFQSGIMGDILEPGNRLGEYAKSADDVVSTAFKGAKTEEFAKFVDVAKRSSGTYTALRDSILTFYKDQASGTVKFADGTEMSGMISPKKHAEFFRKYGQLLDEVPEIKASIQDISKSHKVATSSVLNKELMKKRYEDQQLKKLIDMSDPNKFFNKIKSVDGARSVKNEAKRLGLSTESISRAAASELLRLSTVVKESGKPPVIDPVKMHEVLRNNRGLNLLIEQGHQRSLLNSLRAAEESNFRFNLDISPGETGIIGVLEKITGKTAVSTNTELRARRQGRLSTRHIFESTVLSAFAAMNKRQVNKLLTEAMFDPDLAKITEKLTKEQASKGKVSPKSVKKLWNRLDETGKTALLGEFARNRAGQEEESEE